MNITFSPRWYRSILCPITLLAAPSIAADPAFWPQFHGPNRDNISIETSLQSEWPAEGPRLLWAARGLGYGYSSVAIAGGRILSAGNINDMTVVTAIDMEGEVLWQTPNGPAWTNASAYPGTRGTPTVAGDHVFHESPLGNVVCFEAATGNVVWEVNILEEFNSKNIRWALSESVLVDGNNVICTPGGPDASMVALDRRDGTVVWQAPATDELPGYASPVLFEHKGVRILATLTAKSLIGVNADTGELLWRVDHESYTDQNTLIPIFHDGHLFVSTIRGGSVKWKVNVANGKVTLDEVWRTDDFDNHHGGVVLVDGRIFGVSTSLNRNRWVALDWMTGTIQHVETSVGKGSITYADERLYVLGEDGEMGLVRIVPEGMETVSRFPIPSGGEGNSWAHPVVAGGRLYIRHDTFLYAYDVSE